MTAVLLGRFEQDSPEWHAARHGGVGGSEVAAILGLSPFESRFSLWHRKAGTVGPQDAGDLGQRGHYLEPAVAAWFADQHPEYAVRTTGTWCHGWRSWQRVNPDRLLTRQRGRKSLAALECKSAHEAHEWGEPGSDEVPIYYRTQVMWTLDVLGLDVGYVAVITRNLAFAEYRIEYNVAEAAELRDAAREFLDTVEAGDAPDIDAHSQTYQVLRELHPEVDGTDVELDPYIAEGFIDTRIDLANAKDREQYERSRLAKEMGTAQYAKCNGHTIASRQSKQGGTPYVVAARNLPEPGQLRRREPA